MTRQEKMETLADILEVEPDELKDDIVLNDVETWDSVAVLSFISIMGEQFGKYPLANEIRSYQTIGDLVSAME